ncbi:MAG: hypothetical protein O2971_03670 [Proteobacteria bacterium]|nr:hypothetical protein [Pseudomonadota bacterium]
MSIDLSQAIRDIFYGQKLPVWIKDIFNLSGDSKLGDLPSSFNSLSVAEVKAVNHYINILITRRAPEMTKANSTCFPDSNLILTYEIVKELGLSIRTSNCIVSFLDSRGGKVHAREITLLDLSRIYAMGAKSIMEFLNKMEDFDCSASQELAENPRDVELADNDLNAEIGNLVANMQKISGLNEIHRGDPRFPELDINLPDKSYQAGSTLEDLFEFLEGGYQLWTVQDRKRLRSLIASTHERVLRIEKLPLEKQFEDFISVFYKRIKEENLNAIHNRFGINRDGILTLEQCGNLAGITRERIRQLESKVLKGAKSIPGFAPIFMPKLPQAITIIRDSLGSSAESIQNELISSGVSKIGVSVESILLFSRILRAPEDDLSMSRMRDGTLIVGGDSAAVNQIHTQLSKHYSRNGIADLRLVFKAVSKNSSTLEFSEVLNIVKNIGGWKAIDDEYIWWIPVNDVAISRNRLENVLRKVLSVCDPISIEYVCDGYRRLATFRNSSRGGGAKEIVPPSASAIEAFLAQSSKYSLKDAMVSSNEELDYKLELSSIERALVDGIRASPSGLMSRGDLLRSCIASGFNEMSLSIYMTYSPVVMHIGVDTHAVIGSRTSSGDVSAHMASQSDQAKIKLRTKRLLLCDWDKGQIRIVVKCPEFTSNMVVGSPSSVKQFLINKKFLGIVEKSNESVGTIGVSQDGAIYGMGPYCRQAGLKDDDIFVMKFSLLEEKVYFSEATYEEYLEMLE